ncbi:MAG: TraR/DksA family transcriptional regulator [Flaviaesturariibacter sp.]|nr:TraR/DksA family transcriptional regulator [Flaviaesturariibacter sp.]
MATKKAAPKKAVKAAVPAKKAASKPAPKAAAKPTPSKNTKPTASKPAAKKVAPPAKKAVAAPKKAAPAKKTATKAPVKAAPKKAAPVKKTAPVAKKAATPSKPMSKQASKSTTKEVVKPVSKAAAKPVSKPPVKAAPPKKAEVVAKAPEPVKKPAVTAQSPSEVKQAVKPIAAAPVKKEPTKPAKPFVVPKTSTTRSVKYDPDFTKSVLDTSRQKHDDSQPSQRYSDADLKEFRDLINRKLDTAKKELAYLQGLVTRKDESGDLEDGRYMTMEDGSMSMEREQLSQMASRQIQFIDHLEKAIMRIENKTYGVCRVTGKLIDKARLRAVPHATLSIEAKQMMNK